MARIRTIKPEFFTAEDIVALSALARLLYVALWCEADREGRLEWKPKTFKMRYFPADDCDIAALCDELLNQGVVKLYGSGLACIPSFSRHQHVNPREAQSELPEPENFVAPTPKKVPTSIRDLVLARDEHKCVRCGSEEKLELDHILPQSCGGPHIAENLRTLCKKCNAGRPVAGQALRDDLQKDGLTIEGLRVKFGIDASNLDLHAQVGRERKGKERKGKEGDIPDEASPSPEPTPGSLAFAAYAEAYRTRYRCDPVRNAKVNSIFANLAKQLGQNAPAVAAWYVTSESLLPYTKSSHDPALLLRDAAGLHTRWLQGSPMSTKTAIAADDAVGDMDMVRRVAARFGEAPAPILTGSKPLAIEERAPLI